MRATAAGGATDKSVATKQTIRAAAQRLFAAQGFAAASVRDIAKEAGVDPALVIRYFGSKEALFLETMALDNDFAGIAEAPIEDLGRVIVRRLLARASSGTYYRALMRAADREEVRAYIARLGAAYLIDPLAARMTGEGAALRARLVGAQIAGLLTSLWTLEDADLSAVPVEQIVEIYGRAVQSLIDDPAAA